MREMKDSGVEWIGEIPKNWKICRLKDYAHICNGRDYSEVLAENGDYPVIGSGGPFAKACKPLYQKESVLLGRKGTIDKPLYVDFPFWTVDTMYYTEIKENVSAKYFYYLCTQIEFDFYQYGSALPSMTQRDLYNVNFPYPTLDEQRCIVDYLDRKCSQIDDIITRQQEAIEKLKAYKLSVITEAVTKGLDPNVPMKDSGVEWIGKVPKNWQLSHIGNLVEMGSGGTPDRKKTEYWENGNIPWMSSGEINNEYIYSTIEQITELGLQNSNAKILPVNTVMLGLIGQGKTKGLTAILKNEVCCNQNLAYLIADEKYLHYRYLFYCFKAMYFYMRGLVGESQAGIYSYFLKKLYIPLPDTERQIKISDYLDAKCKAIKTTIAVRESIIERFTDYKRTLIYEIVTGKREV